MKQILFLDQTGKIGGAELSMLDIAEAYRSHFLVGLFEDGPFRELLEQHQVPVQIFKSNPIQVQKDSSFIQGLASIRTLLPLIWVTAKAARDFDIVVANTPKALVVGAIAAALSNRPLVFLLHDILSTDHFSRSNMRLITALANRFSSLVIANSHASKAAFVEAGGRADLVQVVYNGFDSQKYQLPAASLRAELGLDQQFIVGCFSRLSPWKGQHILLEALQYCPEDVVAVLVGDTLFGERDYLIQLQAQISELNLHKRVYFMGFRSNIPQLMAACNLVAHTSTAPEPFGRVIVEGMLSGRPVVAAAAGGAVELVEHGKTGWLTPPGDARKLAEIILFCRNQPAQAMAIAQQAQAVASQKFHLHVVRQKIDHLLNQVMKFTHSR